MFENKAYIARIILHEENFLLRTYEHMYKREWVVNLMFES